MEDFKITKKQTEILYLLYRFRYLTSYQLQLLLNHKNNRRLITWLTLLRNKNCILRKYDPLTKTQYYFLTKKSKEILWNLKDVNRRLLRRVYEDADGKKVFVNHSMFVAQVFFYFESLTKGKVDLNFYTETDLSKFRYVLRPLPDGFISMQGAGKDIKRYFLEVIDEGTPKYAKEKLIDRYSDYCAEGLWEEATKFPFPDLFIVCPNENSMKNLKTYISEDFDGDFSIFLTIKDKIKIGAGLEIWQKAE